MLVLVINFRDRGVSENPGGPPFKERGGDFLTI